MENEANAKRRGITFNWKSLWNYHNVTRSPRHTCFRPFALICCVCVCNVVVSSGFELVHTDATAPSHQSKIIDTWPRGDERRREYRKEKKNANRSGFPLDLDASPCSDSGDASIGHSTHTHKNTRTSIAFSYLKIAHDAAPI